MITDKIREMIDFLPKKDINIAIKFLMTRNFDSLYDLVDSAIYKIRHNPKKTVDPNIDVDILELLKIEIHSYKQYIDDEDDVGYEDTYDEDLEGLEDE